ncbi:LysR family transcriptional regulator [Roseobacter sp. YSTF-M11]|uniref:LysR family transcriptional regulator n=1 Tax=Roseobacter insulae TaxID=2859783 RepID=A0A9X1FZJ5_9RHOB|nr:LysR substrate-binding domain-containing protein [Roseobacter insulae]MBW4709808.1 LysR family transcriptional regulator [Roseobacter insulae]
MRRCTSDVCWRRGSNLRAASPANDHRLGAHWARSKRFPKVLSGNGISYGERASDYLASLGLARPFAAKLLGCRCHSLTHAAAHQYVSQPALSVAITRVEQLLGHAVFVRRIGAAIDVTPCGHGVIAQARNLLLQARKIEAGPDIDAPFVIECFEDYAPWCLAPALNRLAVRKPVQLEDVVENPLILFYEGLSAVFIQKLFQEMRLSPHVRQAVTSLEMMRSLAAQGAGVGICYSWPSQRQLRGQTTGQRSDCNAADASRCHAFVGQFSRP